MSLKISLITVAYNSAKTIKDSLNSVADQIYPHIEHIVVDGASSDGTLELVRNHHNPNIRLVSEPDSGIYDALNKGIRRATGDVVGFMHSDDLFADAAALQRVAAAFADPLIDAVYGDLQYVRRDNRDQVVRYWQSGAFSRNRLGWGWMPPHPTFYVRRSVYERLGMFDTSYRIAADYDCMLRFLGAGGIRVAYIPHVLVKMRLGGESNRSLKNILQKSKEDFRALTSNHVGGVGALVWKNASKLGQFWKR